MQRRYFKHNPEKQNCLFSDNFVVYFAYFE